MILNLYLPDIYYKGALDIESIEKKYSIRNREDQPGNQTYKEDQPWQPEVQ